MSNIHRITGFDYLRVICAIAVVAIHSFDTNENLSFFAQNFLKFPVPVFLIISFFLLVQKVDFNNYNIGFYLTKRCRRLLYPFYFWTILYIISRIISGSNLFFNWKSVISYLFLGSAAVQLYYIPLTIYYSILLLPLIKLLQNKTLIKKYFIVTLALIIAFIVKMLFTRFNYIFTSDLEFFMQYGLPYFIYAVLGLYFATFVKMSRINNDKYATFFPILYIMMISLLIFYLLKLSGFIYLITNVLLFIFFYYADLPQNNLIEYCSKLSFGIYLSHHLFIEIFQDIENYIGIDITTTILTIINFLIAVIISILFSHILYKSYRTRFLII